MGTFAVLMWKHYTVRKRKLLHTFVEFFAPLSLVFALFLLKDDMMKKAPDSLLRSGPEELGTKRLSLNFSEDLPQILFIPDSLATRTLLNNFYPHHKKNQAKAFSKIVERVNHTERNNIQRTRTNILGHDVIVQFENMNGYAIPNKLNYTLKVQPDFPSLMPHLRSHERFENSNIPLLLKIQWTIDSAFLKLKSNKEGHLQPNWDVKIDELPPMMRQKETSRKRLNYVNTVFLLLPFVSFLGPLLPFIFLMIRLLEERSTGIQELVKMVGVTPTMLGITQFLNSLPSCLIFSIGSSALLKMTDEPMVPNTPFVILFIGFFLHFVSMIAMAYACSYIVREAQYTVCLSMFVYIGMWIPIRTFLQDGKNQMVLFLLGLLPHCPTYWYMNEIHTAEVYFFGTGITFSNWDKNYNIWDTGGKNGTVKFSFIMQLVQITCFFMIAWYLERVRPGKYGIALPWYFPFTREYWRTKYSIPTSTAESSQDPNYQKFFEEPPANMQVGIRISHVSKIFGSGKNEFEALKDVNLDVYKGEITVLLGHNGAGKTTLISIITGMHRPTSGKIYVKGMDTVTQQKEVRKHLGLCPQHNLFFPDLTVKEHLVFFTKIKGGTFRDAREAADALMNHLDLTPKANSKTSELSGGLLRRLQLGCALCGNASVLILDEPTSGLDVEARRELWDMLLALRGDRTLLLTTHFMEEADVLGDRLAALHAGRLRSHATPMFLKRAVGSGFRLKIITAGPPSEPEISRVVRQVATQATVRERTANSLIFDLPAGTSMPMVFNTIEKQKTQLHIESLGVGTTTLEEVFIELCCDVEDKLNVEDTREVAHPDKYHLFKGRKLILRQTGALLKRQFDFTKSKIVAFVLLQMILPWVLCLSLTVLFNNQDRAANLGRLSVDSPDFNQRSPMEVSFNVYNDTPFSDRVMDVMKLAYPTYEFRRSDSLKDRKHFIIGVDINGTQAKVLYNPNVHISASVGLNLLSNALAVKTLNDADGRTIEMRLSDDFRLKENPAISVHVPKIKMNCALFATFNIFIIMATAINDVTLPCRERLSVARHTHIMAGCPPVLYWAVTFVYHMACYILFYASASVASAAFRDNDKTIDDTGTLIAYTLALLLSGMDFYAFAYFISFFFNDRSAGMILIGMTVIFGFLSPILMMALDDLQKSDDREPIFNQIMNLVGIFLPAHMFTQAVSKMTDTSRFNSFCKHNFEMCVYGSMPYYSKGFDSALCCTKGSSKHGPFNHYEFSAYAMGWALIIIIMQFIFFTTLVLLLEYGYFNRWWDSVNRKKLTQYPSKQYHNAQVIEEEKYVTARSKLPRGEIQEALLLYRATKTYFKLWSKPTFALKDVHFSIKKGECFGILGANGAGKTTTFKLITCEEAATKGKIFIHDQFVRNHPSQHLGYCPQFFGLDDFRTGAANLHILLTMRGYPDDGVKKETVAWLEVVAMAKLSGRMVIDYSGGMVRRLATAAALCGGGPVTLLDEPTSGVDTAARRLVWTAIRRGLRNDRAVLLTSQNMDEMELLCQRVLLLKYGEVCILGTPLGLRQEFAAGSAVAIKLRASAVESVNEQERVQALKNALEVKFECSLRDEHLTTLYYRITEQTSYEDTFTKMETIEAEFRDLVEDYTVSDTTLEDVFLSFA